MSIFNPDDFLNDEQEELSTERVLVPVGVHAAFIEELSTKSGTSNTDNGEKEWARLDVKYSITEPAVLEEMGRDKVTVTQGYMLQIDEMTGKLSTKKGDNWQLGQLRAAAGKLKGPLNDLIGCQVLIEVKHRVYEGKPQVDVRSVAAVE